MSPFPIFILCAVDALTSLLTLQALISMTGIMASEKYLCCLLKNLVPALKNCLLHTGGLLSAGQLQRMLAHCRQELENQFSALCFTSTTFTTERRGGKVSAQFQLPKEKPSACQPCKL